MIKLDKKHSGVFAAGVYSEQQESNFFPAKMQKKFIRTVQQLFFVQKTA